MEPHQSYMNGKMTVLYIAGEGRSGSTVLSTILGSFDDIVSIGEFRIVWQALKANELCGCGEPVSLCKFWTAVGDYAFGGWEATEIDAMLSADEKFTRHRSIPRHIMLRSRHDTADLKTYREALSRLYDAVRQVSGSRIIVDSTKRASYAYLLRDVPGIDLRVVHLVRDSRGVAYSNAKAQVIKPELAHGSGPGPEHVYMPSRPLWRTAIDWEVKNLLFYPLVRSSMRRRVKYEDLVAQPSKELNAILELAGAERCEQSSWDKATHSFESLPHHTLGGNPIRFRRGRVRLELDDEWRLKLTRGQKALVSAMTFPLLLGYGYVWDGYEGSTYIRHVRTLVYRLMRNPRRFRNMNVPVRVRARVGRAAESKLTHHAVPAGPPPSSRAAQQKNEE